MSVPSFFFTLAGQVIANAVAAVTGKALPVGRDIAIDQDTHDLVLTGGDLVLVADGAAIRQEADIRLQFLLGEWFLDISAGLPFFQNILVKSPNLSAIRSIFHDEILAVDGITTVKTLDLDFNRSTRTLKVSWTADTDFGELSSDTAFQTLLQAA